VRYKAEPGSPAGRPLPRVLPGGGVEVNALCSVVRGYRDVGLLACLRTHAGCSQTDKEGNLGQSGYKGHPMCGFCRQRFYDDGALYTHMQREHYTCHICQRANPNSFVYYHDYTKLEQHFRQAHRATPHLPFTGSLTCPPLVVCASLSQPGFQV